MRFDWDAANIEHIARHAILPEEVEQAFLNQPLVVDFQHRGGEKRALCLGETDTGRLLALVFVERRGAVRVVTAYPMNKKQRQFYLGEG